MKKLLLALLTVSITPSLFAEIYVLEEKKILVDDNFSQVTVLCINGYVFVQTDANAITQMMTREYTNKTGIILLPYRCKEYTANMNAQ